MSQSLLISGTSVVCSGGDFTYNKFILVHNDELVIDDVVLASRV